GLSQSGCQAFTGRWCVGCERLRSRVVWECSPKRVVNSI
uniref:Augerpeptide hhe53 n=1 Tax=Hastula hectica TaxID=745793 RepID=TE53_HASHE|nr:RecName: Full=Augerpeptide hhe53 [Hastula hectica]